MIYQISQLRHDSPMYVKADSLEEAVQDYAKKMLIVVAVTERETAE